MKTYKKVNSKKLIRSKRYRSSHSVFGRKCLKKFLKFTGINCDGKNLGIQQYYKNISITDFISGIQENLRKLLIVYILKSSGYIRIHLAKFVLNFVRKVH